MWAQELEMLILPGGRNRVSGSAQKLSARFQTSAWQFFKLVFTVRALHQHTLNLYLFQNLPQKGEHLPD